MSTNTFDRRIEIQSMRSMQRLLKFLSDDTPAAPISQYKYTDKDRERSEELLDWYFSH